MAEHSTQPAGDPASTLGKPAFKTHFASIKSERQVLADAQMAHAAAHKRFQEAGGNSQALKLVQKLQKQGETYAGDFLKHLKFYLECVNFPVQLDLIDMEPQVSKDTVLRAVEDTAEDSEGSPEQPATEEDAPAAA